MKEKRQEIISQRRVVLYTLLGKMIELTFQYDTYMKEQIRKLEMLWTVTLNNGATIYSDYDRYSESPWERTKKYCRENNLFPVQVKSLMFGAPSTVLFEDKNGLNGLFIKRGCIKDIEIDGGSGSSIAYKKLVVGLYDPVHDVINVRKFCWPENELEPLVEVRLLTLSNLEEMYFINEQDKDRKKAVLLT
jgi:hypothetical protein